MRYSHYSLIGRILMLKTLIASRFVYKLSVLPSPTKQVLTMLDRAHYAYLWNGKGRHIAKHVMEKDITQGGFLMLNVHFQEMSLKFVWLERLLQDND